MGNVEGFLEENKEAVALTAAENQVLLAEKQATPVQAILAASALHEDHSSRADKAIVPSEAKDEANLLGNTDLKYNSGAQAKPSQVPNPNSKNQQKKKRKREEWEEGREARKLLRKEKIRAQKERKRERVQNELGVVDGSPGSGSGDGNTVGYGRSQTAPAVEDRAAKIKARQHPVLVPLTIIVDCQFDDYMRDPERISLGSQLTRCYSDNRKSQYRAHLAVSSFGGQLKERFEGLLAGVYKNWVGVRFRETDWVEVGKEARQWMADEVKGGKLVGALAGRSSDAGQAENNKKDTEDKTEQAAPKANTTTTKPPTQITETVSTPPTDSEIIYLTSDSPHTLSALAPYTTYVIGGIVDKNRHKGICYKLATEASVRHTKDADVRISTAKLPIGQYLAMDSRKVLTTNHVNEIMLKWLELGDWGEAFMAVIPKRKGGELKMKKGSNGKDVESLKAAETLPKDEEDESGDDSEQDE
ncbi:hypothetical protein FH972_022637 [Carpinus fangiana]|uniref:tRNA (guanine(9)-N(1))-methyltransferase n=1 Tax=Carpinus fangiana TaxID=176857 RepID=A0A5N6KV26_9ROSI|nr:hypothetical protein FH972_022637 [Carpinus fangiana]